MIVFDIDRVCRDLGRCVAVADVPRDFEQAQRVFRANFEQRLRRGLDQNEAAIFEFQRIAIIQDGGLFKIEQEAEALFAGQGNPAAMPTFMIQTDRIDNPFRLYSRLANNRCCALHRVTFIETFRQATLEQKIALRHRQFGGRFADKQFPIGGDGIGFRINENIGRCIIMNHRGF